MPVGPGKFRVVTTKGGKQVRLHFAGKSGRVNEAKNLDSGATHTPKEFAADAKKKKRGDGFMNAMMRNAT